ncbi:MAG: 4-hydroxythreonine-4-phosphate dehydrogenase PdxA [Candidatus Cloacimonetes bacterium]|nr:4-hydroxythreonine-4-phosphate dehydrogenase PdxA [Candidatus Cloacimonadota bacterium]
MKINKIAITSGDPAGIGPEICAKALSFLKSSPDRIIIVYGRIEAFHEQEKLCKITRVSEAVSPLKLYWLEIDDNRVLPGKPGRLSGKIAYSILDKVTTDLLSGKLQAVVTGPVAKSAIRLSQPDFIGHTEYFARRSQAENVVMSFWGPYFNLALLTTHLPVCDVSRELDRNRIKKQLRLIYKQVSRLLPLCRMAMLAVNPHAGEDGAFGSDDIMLGKILNELRKVNIHIDGPFPADAFFAGPAVHYDLIISAYHDQGLIPFKMISRDEGVNVTLGLPFVRTSVDHGTAYDIAGKGIASEKSLLQALNMAERLLKGTISSESDNYTVFAPYYDQYMSHVNYQQWVRFILKQYSKRYHHHPRQILELACGTASISNLLVKMKLNVTASDSSAEMLKIATAKNFAPQLSCHNMLDPLPPKKFDLVLLIFDSFNYLLTHQEVEILLTNTYHALTQKGMFIFDITTRRNCEENFDGFVNLEDREDNYLIHQSDLDYNTNIQTTKLTFFLKKGFLFERKDEIHQQRIFTVADIKYLIEKTPFILSGIFSPDHTDNLLQRNPEILDNTYTRLFFILEKNAVSK